MEDDERLDWNGAAKPKPTGGFVASVGLNEHAGSELAVDPDGAMPSSRAGAPRATALDSGPTVTVHRIGPAAEPRTRPSGRMHIKKG